MNESAEQFIRQDLRSKLAWLVRLFEVRLREGASPASALVTDEGLYAAGAALARATQVVQGDAGAIDDKIASVLTSFNPMVLSSADLNENNSGIDVVQVAKTQYLTLVRGQSIKLRAAALEAGQALVSAGALNLDVLSNRGNTYDLLEPIPNHLLCLADLGIEAELESARQLLGRIVEEAFSGFAYKRICTAYRWLGVAAVAPAPCGAFADDIAMQVLFQPSVLRRGLREAPWSLLQQLFVYLKVNPSEALLSYAQALLLEVLGSQARSDAFKVADANFHEVLLSVDVCCRALQAGQAVREKSLDRKARPLPFLRASAVAKVTGGEFSPPLKQDYAYPELTFSTAYLKRTGIFVGRDSHWGFEPSDQRELTQAIEKGASLVIVSDQERPPNGQYLSVQNTFTALVKLALARRETFRGRVVGVTGSVGKTTVCSMVTSLLEVHGEVYKNISNFNHQPGVPKSVANIPRSARYAVIEMGMGAQRTILPKALMVRPHTAVVTDIQADHMEFHESIGSVVTTKMEVIWGLESGGTVVLNRDSEHFPTMNGLALQRPDINVLTFGRHPLADIRAEDIVLCPTQSKIKVCVFGKTLNYTLGLPGMHMVFNSLVAVAVLVAEGVDLGASLPAFEKIKAEKRRNQQLRAISSNGAKIQILDDSFNTNPASIRSNLHVLGLMQPEADGRRILVLSDMGEMGSDALHYHTALAEDINESQVDIFLSIGEHCRALDKLINNRITHKNLASPEKLEGLLQALLRDGDIISFKGSARKTMMVDLIKGFTDGRPHQKALSEAPSLVEFFNRRFKEDAYNLTKISEQEKHAIGYLVQQTIALDKSASDDLWLVDFGCGDGRLQPLYNLLAETFSTVKFHILGVDFAVEALKAYRTRCIEQGFDTSTKPMKIAGVSDSQRLGSLERGNITIDFLEGGVEALSEMTLRPDQRCEILVAAGVLCRVLGEHCRREMVEAFSRIAFSAFVSMPTRDEFRSIQREFNTLRRERLQLINEIKKANRKESAEIEAAKRRLVTIEEVLKDALVDGEIYYSAKRVRGFGEKIPELKDHKIPYFSATETQAQQVIDYGAYNSTSVTQGAFGGHSRWMICLGSHSFSIDSNEIGKAESKGA